MAFAHSTHFQHWFFTPEALQTEKQETYERGIAHLDCSNGAAAAMTLEEEDLLKRHYQTTIQEVCAKMGVPDKVMASAITYFKRYFLKHPITHHSLKHIMATCIYVAGKIEECVIPATDLAAHLKMEAKQILAQEIPLLEGLEFQFVVYHPHRPLHGFVLDLKERADTPPNIDDIWIHARELIHRVLTTDVPFLYTPSQVALACLHQAAADKEVSLAKYIHERFSNNAGFKDLLETVKKIQAFMGKQSAPVDPEQVQSLHEKYAQCMLPELNPKSEAFKRKREKDKEEKDKERQKKMRLLKEEEKAEVEFLTGASQGSDGEEEAEAKGTEESEQREGEENKFTIRTVSKSDMKTRRVKKGK